MVSGRACVWHTHYQNKAGQILATRVVNRKFSVAKYHLKSYAWSRITRKRVPTKAVPINLDFLITNFLRTSALKEKAKYECFCLCSKLVEYIIHSKWQSTDIYNWNGIQNALSNKQSIGKYSNFNCMLKKELKTSIWAGFPLLFQILWSKFAALLFESYFCWSVALFVFSFIIIICNVAILNLILTKLLKYILTSYGMVSNLCLLNRTPCIF